MNPQETKKILLIEDDKINGSMYQTTFSANGFECVWVDSGEKGLQKLKSFFPKLILLDVRLENSMDGFEVLEIVKKDKKLKKIPVWLLTNIWETGNREKGFSLGAEDFILKTEILPLELVKKVKKKFGM